MQQSTPWSPPWVDRTGCSLAVGLTIGGWVVSHQRVLTAQSGLIPEGAVVRALADPLRARIVELLAGEQLCTCHLVEATGARQTNISNHLRVLREAGLIRSEPVGRYTYHRLRPDRLAQMAEHYAALAARAQQASEVRRPCG